jgi:ferric-dicitrate binding protein FerR (iron transport regulator)
MNKDLEELINKYLSNSCTEAEKAVVEAWYRSFETNDNFLDMLPVDDQQLMEDRLLHNIHQGIVEEEHKIDSDAFELPVAASRKRKFLFRIAAVLLPALAVTALLYYILVPHNVKVYETLYGEKRKVILPDGSEVVLNGNSTVKTIGNWKDNDKREVWISGEAFFSVKHTANSQAFQVHTANGVMVEVLGTDFNVKSRTSGTQVLLQSGKVRLGVEGNNGRDTLTMKPGDLVEVATALKGQARTVVHPDKYILWQDQKMLFSNAAIRDIIKMLQETYGYDIVIKNPAILDLEVNGTIPNNNIDILLKALEESVALKITKEGNMLTIAAGE